MSAAHGSVGSLDSLFGALDTPVHRLDARVELVCLFGFLIAVVATPPHAVTAFVTYALMVVVVAVIARIPAGVMARRLAIEIPFVVFAVALPFVGGAPHHRLAGVAVSVPGLWAAWSIVVKATLCGAATVILSWSTPVADILVALDRIGVPRVLTAIAGFMIRYLDTVTSELSRLQVARVSRGDDPRWFFQARAVATTVGVMFVRSFERGERVHRAMLSRGFSGSFPTLAATPSRWFPALLLPTVAWFVAAAAILR